jgi:hypothetical protein
MTSWALARARFNHDRLKNQFVQSVLRMIRALQGATMDDEFVDDFMAQLPVVWAALESEALALLDGADEHLGPAVWLRRPPLDRLEAADRAWMQELLSRDWNAHSPVPNVIADAHSALAGIRHQIARLREAYAFEAAGIRPADRRSALENADALAAATALHERCQRLASCLGRLSIDDSVDALAAIDRRVTS